jgi:hypothetical protein
VSKQDQPAAPDRHHASRSVTAVNIKWCWTECAFVATHSSDAMDVINAIDARDHFLRDFGSNM